MVGLDRQGDRTRSSGTCAIAGVTTRPKDETDYFRFEVASHVVLKRGVSEEALAAAELRLGLRLPPSYREFLHAIRYRCFTDLMVSEILRA